MGWVRTLAMCVAALAALTVSSSAQNAGQGDGRRVALVIGNASYGDMGVLTNPVRDAKAIAAALKNAGFATVVEAEELDVEKFQRSLREFRRVADGSSIALIYFAGHGMEVYGQNWLIPLSANITTPNDLPLEAIALEQLLRSLSGASTKVLILDACRNNPFARSIRLPGGAVRSSTTGGLAPVNEAAVDGDDNGGLLVMYAAAPGTTADDGLPSDANSPFARALVSKLPTRGVDIRRMAGGVRDLTLEYTGRRQRPFTTDSLGEADVFLAAGAGDTPVAATGAQLPASADAQRLLARAVTAGTRGDCQAIKDIIGLFSSDPITTTAQSEYKRCVDTYLDRLVAIDTSSVSQADLERHAMRYGIEVAVIKAVLKVETGSLGGFSANGRPTILYEPHIFSRLTQRRFDATNPAVSYSSRGARPYPRTQEQRWAQLREAYALDPEAAVSATSWGSFLILGMNYARGGYTSATEFVAALSRSQSEQLQAFFSFVQASNGIDELQRLDFEGFARIYNGAGQVERYGRLMREAYLASGGDAARLPAAPPPRPAYVDRTPPPPALRPAPAAAPATPLARALTTEDLAYISNDTPAPGVVEALNLHMARYGVNTPMRAAHFLAQISRRGHISRLDGGGGSEFNERLDLGNREAADAVKYRRRGLFQIFGRNAYASYGEALGVDLVGNPDLLATPDVAVRAALLYWTRGYHGNTPYNTLADRDDVDSITVAIGGEQAAGAEDDFLNLWRGSLQAAKRRLGIPYTGVEIPNLGEPAAPWRVWGLGFGVAALAAGAAFRRRRA